MMTITVKEIICGVLLLMLLACSDHGSRIGTTVDGKNAGGATTVYVRTTKAFGMPAANLTADHLELHTAGDLAFEASFVSNPSPKNGGLGPVFNNNACNSCHPTDSRANVPDNVNDLSGFFLRLSIPGENEHGGPNPVPGFGGQMQHQSLYGTKAEAKITRTYDYIDVELSDGKVVTLQSPTYGFKDAYMAMPANVMLSPRIGMPVFGLGLLEAIAEEDILAHEDVLDADGDGISGKANYVWDPETKSKKLGRFGWKAGAPSILAQSAGAYSEDMGLTTTLHPIPSSYGQSNGDTAITQIEVSDSELEKVVFYCLTLGVPAARNLDDPEVAKGYQVFEQLKCNSCHVPSFTTGIYAAIPELSNQKIYPYTDMLLHDMGDGLADNRPEFLADGKEWKTRPLWGIGLTAITSGETHFLHDGRARNMMEAILWHGGEAEQSMLDFKALSTTEREHLLLFLNSL